MTVAEQATFGGATEIDDFGDPDPVSTDSPDGGDDIQDTSGDGDFEPAPDDAPVEQPAEPAEAPAPAKTEPEAVIPADERHFGHLVEEGKVKAEQKVIAILGGRERDGTFKRAVFLDGKVSEIVVQVGTEDRQFKPRDVKLPE